MNMLLFSVATVFLWKRSSTVTLITDVVQLHCPKMPVTLQLSLLLRNKLVFSVWFFILRFFLIKLI